MYVNIMEVLGVGLLTIVFYLFRKRCISEQMKYQNIRLPDYSTVQSVPKFNVRKCVYSADCNNDESCLSRPKYKRDPDQEDIGHHPYEG